MPIMTLLARRKIAIATQLGSRAIRTDAAESITCGWLSLVVNNKNNEIYLAA
jgi:hypothetical protein